MINSEANESLFRHPFFNTLIGAVVGSFAVFLISFLIYSMSKSDSQFAESVKDLKAEIKVLNDQLLNERQTREHVFAEVNANGVACNEKIDRLQV